MEDIFGQVGEEEGVAGTAAKIEMLELAGQLHRLRIKLQKTNQTSQVSAVSTSPFLSFSPSYMWQH